MKHNWFLTVLMILLPCICIQYAYSQNDWENPAVFRVNNEPHHASFIPHLSEFTAISYNKTASPFYKSLNGIWKFKWVKNPSEVPAGFFAPEFDISGWDMIEVPGNWQLQGKYDPPVFTNIKHPFNADPPLVPKDHNPTGLYRTNFTVPENWQNKPVFLHFDGIESAGIIWINGQKTGYNEDSRTPAEYNITRYLKTGENVLAVEVISITDGSYLEDQDFWRMSGICRDVWLYSTPDIHIRDFQVITDLDDNYTDAVLDLTLKVQNYSSSGSSAALVKVTLSDAHSEVVLNASIPVQAINAGKEKILSLKKKSPLPESGPLKHRIFIYSR